MGIPARPRDIEVQALTACRDRLPADDLSERGVAVHDVTLEGEYPATELVVRWTNPRSGEELIDGWALWRLMYVAPDGRAEPRTVAPVVGFDIVSDTEEPMESAPSNPYESV